MEKHYIAKYLFAAGCAALFMSAAPAGAWAQENSDEWATEVLDFGGVLAEPETFYISSDASHLDGYNYKTILEADGYEFSHYWADYAPGFSGGFTYSNCTDVTTPGYLNLSAFTGSGYGDDTYLISYYSAYTMPTLTRAGGMRFAPQGAYVTNATYAALSMLQGDAVAKKFGGADGTDPDWFRLVVRGYLEQQAVEDTVVFYLADYRAENSDEDYVVRDWTYVDLTPLGVVDSMTFELQSTDVGAWGINTPTYFCMDNLEIAMPSLTGVTAVEADSDLSACVSYAGGVLNLKGLAGTDVAVYSLSGVLVATYRVETDEYACTPELLPGRYVVSTVRGGQIIQVNR